MIISPLPALPTSTFNTPTPSFADIRGSASVLTVLLTNEDPDYANIPQLRTTTSIVLSCLTTVLTCTWVALHLNTPKSNLSTWGSFWRRFGWMIVALIVPELIGGIAIKERFAAKKYMDEWNANFVSICSPSIVTIRGKTPDEYERQLKDKKYDSRWTLTHGFLADMGGIRLHGNSDTKPQKFIPSTEIFENPKMRPIIQKIGLISTKDIDDKSKGDWMAKIFVIIQTTWFVVQCLARWATHLPVTELELVTLVYAAQNIFIYILWWSKPQGLCVPFRMYLEKAAEKVVSEPAVKDPEQVTNKPATKPVNDEEDMSLHDLNSNVVHNLEESNANRRSPNPNIPDEATNANSDLSRSDSPRGQSHRGLLAHEWVQPTHSGVTGFFIGFFGGSGYWIYFFLAGGIFGALHLIPLWLSNFPSDREKLFWRYSAIYVTVAPLGAPIALVLVSFILRAEPDVYIFCTVLAYGIARVILLILSFTTLRQLPKEAFLDTEWTRLIPHFRFR